MASCLGCSVGEGSFLFDGSESVCWGGSIMRGMIARLESCSWRSVCRYSIHTLDIVFVSRIVPSPTRLLSVFTSQVSCSSPIRFTVTPLRLAGKHWYLSVLGVMLFSIRVVLTLILKSIHYT